MKVKNDFTKNILILMSGTTIAQAIPIVISPILTRIYTPADFGIFALFLAISSVFGSIANARYDMAIILPKKDEDAINILALGFLITLFISLISFLIVITLHYEIIGLLRNDEISIWLYFIPISIFLIGIFNLLTYFNNRKKYYKDISKSLIIKSIVLAVVQLIGGFLDKGVSGLISGQLFSQLLANTRLLKNIIIDEVLISQIKIIKIIALSKRYSDFPKYSMWAVFANTLSLHLINILISLFYNISTLGFYSLVQRVMGIPSSIIGTSISQVFFKEASLEKQNTGRSINTFNTTLFKLVLFAIPSFLFLYLVVEDLFTIVFGNSWSIAGEYAKIVIPLFFIRFISSSLSPILSIYEKQKNELLINIILIITGLVLILSINEFILFLHLYTYTMLLIYLLSIIYYYKLSNGMCN